MIPQAYSIQHKLTVYRDPSHVPNNSCFGVKLSNSQVIFACSTPNRRQMFALTSTPPCDIIDCTPLSNSFVNFGISNFHMPLLERLVCTSSLSNSFTRAQARGGGAESLPYFKLMLLMTDQMFLRRKQRKMKVKRLTASGNRTQDSIPGGYGLFTFLYFCLKNI